MVRVGTHRHQDRDGNGTTARKVGVHDKSPTSICQRGLCITGLASSVSSSTRRRAIASETALRVVPLYTVSIIPNSEGVIGLSET